MAKILGYVCSTMVRVGIGELRDNVSRFVRRAAQGETIVIVNREREVAVLAPFRRRRRKTTRLLGCLKGSARIKGDIVAPILPEDDWFKT